MSRILLSLLGSLFLLSACHEEEDGPVFVRVINTSDSTYDQVALWEVSEEEAFGILAPGDTSAYQPSFYRVDAGFIVQIGVDTLLSVCILSDKSPPQPLAPGYYTYEITVFEANTQLLYSAHRTP